MSQTSKEIARAGANGLSIVRGASGLWLAHELHTTPPEDRTWQLTRRVATLVATDKVDGVLGKYAGNSSFGSWIDQMADKAFVLPPMWVLTQNGEIEPHHIWIKSGRDIGVTALRSVVHLNGGSTAAEGIGKAKACLEMGGLLVASSPLSHEHPDLTNQIFEAATALNVISGAYYAKALGTFAVAALRGEGQEEAAQELLHITQ